jgi:hypothetical protein
VGAEVLAGAEYVINGSKFLLSSVDLKASAKTFWCLPGKSILATPHYHSQMSGDFALPDQYTRRVKRRTPAGLVLGAHADTGMRVGDIALVDALLAKRVRNLAVGDVRVKSDDGEVWLFGCTSPQVSTSYPTEPKRYAFAVMDRPNDFQPQTDTPPAPTMEIEPRYRAIERTMALKGSRLERPWVILKLPEKTGVIRGLYMPDNCKNRDDMAVVEAVSPGCKHVRPGHLVWYQRRALEGLYALGKDFGALPEYAIFAILNP